MHIFSFSKHLCDLDSWLDKIRKSNNITYTHTFYSSCLNENLLSLNLFPNIDEERVVVVCLIQYKYSLIF